MERGNWTDKPCYYVSVMDAGRTALLVGPFRHQRQAASAVCFVRRIAETQDFRAAFYAFGTAKCATGHREGSLNKLIDMDTIPSQPRQAVRNPGQYRF